MSLDMIISVVIQSCTSLTDLCHINTVDITTCAANYHQFALLTSDHHTFNLVFHSKCFLLKITCQLTVLFWQQQISRSTIVLFINVTISIRRLFERRPRSHCHFSHLTMDSNIIPTVYWCCDTFFSSTGRCLKTVLCGHTRTHSMRNKYSF